MSDMQRRIDNLQDEVGRLKGEKRKYYDAMLDNGKEVEALREENAALEAKLERAQATAEKGVTHTHYVQHCSWYEHTHFLDPTQTGEEE